MARRITLPLTGTARAIRLAAGVGTHELKRRLGYTSAGGISSLEGSAARSPSLTTLDRIAQACGFRLVLSLEKIGKKSD